jgi:hypothetical protein
MIIEIIRHCHLLLPGEENTVAIRMHCKHGIGHIILVALPAEQFRNSNNMLQGPLFTDIVLKNPNVELAILIVIYLPCIQVSLSDEG